LKVLCAYFTSIFSISLAITLLFFAIQWNVGLNLADEGYLWYGVQAVCRGETPILDFQSYDPGRYDWCAFFFQHWRPGLVSLRFSESIFAFFGLWAGLFAVQKQFSSRWEIVGLGALLGLWMFPDYKFFDCCLPLIGIWMGLQLMETGSSRQALAAWVFVGLAFWIGRNHGLYLTLAFFFLTLERVRSAGNGLSLWGWSLGGLILGLLPFAWLGLEKEGFWQAYGVQAFRIFQWGSTNLALPIPWIGAPFQGAGGGPGGHWFIAAAANLLPPAYGLGLLQFWRHRKNPAPLDKILLVCSLIGTSYLHYFYSRADLEHLAVALSPLWIGLSAWLASRPRLLRPFLVGMILLCFLGATAPYHLYKIRAFSPTATVKYPMGPDEIWIYPDQAYFLNAVARLLKYQKPGQSFLILPHWPTLYAVFGIKSPCWEIYSGFPASCGEQEKMIGEMEKNHVRWALIDESWLDGREDLGFPQTHPKVWKYLNDHYRLFPKPFCHVADRLFFNPRASQN
jgi:hypothetical protein